MRIARTKAIKNKIVSDRMHMVMTYVSLILYEVLASDSSDSTDC